MSLLIVLGAAPATIVEDDPPPLFLQRPSRLATSAILAFALGACDDFVPVAPAEDASAVVVAPWAQTPPALQLWVDSDETSPSFVAPEDAPLPLVLFYSLDAPRGWFVDEDVPLLSGQPDEDFWQNPTAPAAASIYLRLPIGDPEEIPGGYLAGQPDEDYWVNPVSPVENSVYLRLPIGDPEEIPGALFGQPADEWWTALRLDRLDRTWASLTLVNTEDDFVVVPAVVDDEATHPRGQYAETLPRAALWNPEDVPGGSLSGQPDEDFWRNPTAPVEDSIYQRLPLGDPEEIPGGHLVGQPDEDFWSNPTPPVADSIYLRLPLGDPEEIPGGSLSGQPDEDFWSNPTTPVADSLYLRLPLGDPEEIPGGSLSGQPDEDFWQNPTPPVAASLYLRLPLGDPEEIPGGSLSGQPDEDFWSNPTSPVADSIYQQLPLGDPEEIAAGSLIGQPDEDFWQNPTPPVADSLYLRLPLGDQADEDSPQTSIIQAIGIAGGTVSLRLAASIVVPPLALPGVVDIEITDLGAPPPGYNALSNLFRFGPSGQQFALPVTVSIAVPQGTTRASLYWSDGAGYAPIPSTLIGGFLVAAVTHFSEGFATDEVADEDFWQNPTPPVAASVYLRLPLGYTEEVPVGNLTGQPNEDYWSNPIPPVAASFYQRFPISDPREVQASTVVENYDAIKIPFVSWPDLSQPISIFSYQDDHFDPVEDYAVLFTTHVIVNITRQDHFKSVRLWQDDENFFSEPPIPPAPPAPGGGGAYRDVGADPWRTLPDTYAYVDRFGNTVFTEDAREAERAEQATAARRSPNGILVSSPQVVSRMTTPWVRFSVAAPRVIVDDDA